MAPVIDLRDWPLQRVEWPRVTTDAFVCSLEADITAVLRRREHYANLSVCPADMKVPSSKQRAELARMQRAFADDLRRYCVADAVVMPSPITRGVVTVINWLAPPGQPQKAFADVPSALAWIDSQLALVARRRPSAGTG